MQASTLLLRCFSQVRLQPILRKCVKPLASSSSLCPLTTSSFNSSWRPLFSMGSTRFLTSNAELLEQVNTELEGEKDESKKFCVVHLSGRQFKVTANDLIVINRIPAKVGAEIFLEKVLLAGTDNFTLVGTPILSEEVVRVRATVVEHNKMAKVIVFKKKRRKNYKRTKGHRQPITTLRINSIQMSSLQ